MKKEISLESYYHLINHGPCVLVTSGHGEKKNVAPIAWLTPVNDEPPLIGIAIAEGHYTAELVKETGEMVINIPDKSLLSSLKMCGKVSGRKENKFEKACFTEKAGIKVKVPHIDECPAFLECRVKDELSYDGVILFIVEVLYAAAEEELYDDYWITDKAQTVHHMGGSYFAVTGNRFKV